MYLYLILDTFRKYLPQPCQVQGYSYDQQLEYVDIDFNVPHTPIVGLGQ